MIMNLLFTALCLGLAFIVTLDTQAPRAVQRVREPRQDRDNRSGSSSRE
jgi:hypothetical protein